MENNIKGKLSMGTDITIFLTKNELKELKNRKLEGSLTIEIRYPLLEEILTPGKFSTKFPFSLELSESGISYKLVSITLPNEVPTKYEIKILDYVYDTLEKEGLFETIYIREEKFRIEITS